MCRSVLQPGGSFMWLFSIIQWLYMARCQNIDYLSFNHVSVKGSEMSIELNVKIMKKRGKKLSPKHFYANPIDYTIFICAEMGDYFSLLNSAWSNKNQYMMLIKPRSIVGSVSSRYTDCIKNWVITFCEVIENFIRPKHVSAYSNRKGIAAYASLVTTAPPLYLQYSIVVNVHLVKCWIYIGIFQNLVITIMVVF